MTRRPYSPPTLRELVPRRCARKGRFRIHLRRGHPWAQASGQVWRYRLCVMLHLGRALGPDEQVDHLDGDRTNDRPENLRVLVCDAPFNHYWWRQAIAVAAEYLPGSGFYEYETPQPVEVPF